MPFAPTPNPQMDNTTYARYNCVLASSVMLIDRATVSAKRPRTSSLRYHSKVTALRGVTYGEAAVAAKVFGVTLEPRYGLSRESVKNLVDGGRAIGISIDTSVTRYTSRRTGTFVGGHTIYVNDYRWVTSGCRCERNTSIDHAEYQCEDPGTTSAGYLWWSASLLYRAAEKRGGGKINVLVSRDTEGVSRVAVMSGGIRAASTSTAAKIKSISVGTSYAVTYTVTGGTWRRSNGTYGNGWHHVSVSGPDGYIRGEALR